MTLFRSVAAISEFISLTLSTIIIDVKIKMLCLIAVYQDIRDAKYNKTGLPKRSEHVAIVTGGSRGIGVDVVKMLMRCDMDVIVACRNIAAGDAMITEIRESGITSGKARVYELDLTSLESVRKFADKIKRDYHKVNVLINNAGVMFTPQSVTEDGFEYQWSINYLSHFLLTALLMPLLRNAGRPDNAARIINVSSCAHIFGKINFEDINYTNQFISISAYAQSKLAQVMFTKTLHELTAERNLHVHSYVVHPGIVDTDLFQYTFLGYCKWFTNLFFKTPAQGATTTVYAAVSKDLEGVSGIYLSNCREAPVNPLANDAKCRDRLLRLSLEQVKLKDFFEYL